MRPRFEYGDGVRVLRNIRNDGTFPGARTGALLVRRGDTVTAFALDGAILDPAEVEELCPGAEDRMRDR